MGSKEFLDSLINKIVKITLKGEDFSLVGTLIWDDGSSIGIIFNPNKDSFFEKRIVLYYKSAIKSIEGIENVK